MDTTDRPQPPAPPAMLAMPTMPAALDVLTAPLTGIQLVEASAGTGKTWAICALVLRLLVEAGHRIDQVLVVTFTQAATAELRERIRSRIAEALARLRAAADGSAAPAPHDAFLTPWLARLPALGHAPQAVARRLDLALQGFDQAAVLTIHAFCQRALADAAFSAGAPFEQTLLADDAELRQQVVNDFWRRHVAGPDSAVTPLLADHLLQRGDSPQAWARLVREALARPLAELRWPPGLGPWPAPMADRRSADGLETDGSPGSSPASSADTPPDSPPDAATLQALFDELRQQWQADRDGILQALGRGLSQLNGNVYRADGLRRGADDWDALLAGQDLLAQPGKKALLYTRAVLELRTRKDKRTPVHPFFDAAQRFVDQRRQALQALARARLSLLRSLLQQAGPALAAAKRQQRVAAFDDLLANLHRQLYPAPGSATVGATALARALRRQYPAALIDEFQDTDPLQWAVFHRVYATPAAAGGTAPTLVLVGDPKQAIYAFRHADLHTYLAARQQAQRLWTLTDNQRASGPLIDGLNALFGRHPRAFMLPGLDHQAVRLGAKPRPTLGGPGAPSAALQLWRLPRDGRGNRLQGQAQAVQSAIDASAAQVARWLADAQAGRLLIDGRPLAAGDIAVLVRTHRHGRMVRQALAVRDIGSVELSQASVWATPDADELACVLAAIADPGREPRVRAALATAAGGLDAAQILALADDESAWLQRVQALQRWRETWQRRGIGSALRQWMADDGVAARLLARPDGPRRLTNLRHLAELLGEASAEHPGPDALLRWMRSQRREARPGDEATQLRLESDRHLVQIVTIHQSKGLEYPFVLCPLLWLPPRPPATGGDLLAWHDDEPADGSADGTADGCAADPDPAGRTVLDFRWAPGLVGDDEAALKAQDKACAPILRQIRREAMAEDLRLIYVALTRAVHHCAVVVGAWGSGGARSVKPAARSPLNWLLLGENGSVDAWLDPAETVASADAIDGAWADFAAAAGAGTRLDPLPDAAAVPDAAAMPGDDRAGTTGTTGTSDQAGSSDTSGTSGGPGAADVGAPALAGAAAVAPLAALPPLTALPPPASIPPAWRIGSYSGLAHGARHEGAAQDHDLLVADDDGHAGGAPSAATGPGAAGGTDAAEVDADDILRFPRGPVAGDCLHAMFEAADFTQPAGWPQAIEAALRRHGPALAADQPLQALQRSLARLLADVVATPLPVGTATPLRLDRLPRAHWRAEVAFHLPSPNLQDERLNSWLARHGYPMPPLAFGRLQGWLKGFIDGVLCHDGRWFVLDWKSNHLGLRPHDYGRQALDRAMARQGYHLQHLLYSVALRRWLAQRLPGFDPGRQFGGVLYLFVRGLRPGWHDGAGHPAGLYHHRADEATLDALDALLADAPRSPR